MSYFFKTLAPIPHSSISRCFSFRYCTSFATAAALSFPVRNLDLDHCGTPFVVNSARPPNRSRLWPQTKSRGAKARPEGGQTGFHPRRWNTRRHVAVAQEEVLMKPGRGAARTP